MCLTSAEKRGRITSLMSLMMFFLMQPKRLSAFFATRPHCWLMISLMSTRTPSSFSAKLLSSWMVPACTGAWGCSFPVYVTSSPVGPLPELEPKQGCSSHWPWWRAWTSKTQLRPWLDWAPAQPGQLSDIKGILLVRVLHIGQQSCATFLSNKWCNPLMGFH